MQEEEAIAEKFKEDITLLIHGSIEMSIEVTNNNQWTIRLKGTND